MSVGCIWIFGDGIVGIYHKKSDECKEGKRDEEEGFTHMFYFLSPPIYFLDKK